MIYSKVLQNILYAIINNRFFYVQRNANWFIGFCFHKCNVMLISMLKVMVFKVIHQF